MPNDRNIQKKSTGINSKFEHDYSKRYIFMAGALNLTASQEDIKAVTSRIHITRRNDRYTYSTAMHQAVAFPLDPGDHSARRRQRSFIV